VGPVGVRDFIMTMTIFKSDFFSDDPQIFFNGDHIGQHICQCGENESCLTDSTINYLCNCDAKAPIWAEDQGVITAKDILPIQAFSYGPLTYDSEMANITIGRLKCSGTIFKHFNLFFSNLKNNIIQAKKLIRLMLEFHANHLSDQVSFLTLFITSWMPMTSTQGWLCVTWSTQLVMKMKQWKF
jgi:hypothetical protein